jgi:hypothetical protein
MIQVKKYNAFITESKTEAIYNDYPAAAKANAKKAIEWRDKHGRDEVDGGTEVGWARANQLAKGEKLSRDVVSRMAQFNRHRKNSKVSAEYKDEPWKDRGYIAWLIWGGDEGVDWAMAKMDEIEKMDEAVKFDTESTGRDDWDKDLKKSGDRFTQFEVNMSPDEFLKRVQADRFKQDPTKIKKYAGQFKRGAKDVPTPTMWFMNKFQWERGLAPSFHDGSHRVLALKEIGIKEIPVKIIHEKKETNEKVDLDKVEKYADKVMSPTDVEFTKHFYDQLTRAEHDKAITDAELIGFFKRLAKKKKEFDKFKQDYDQFVAKDSRSEINIPFKNKVDQIIAKTVMRKSDFKTSNAEYTFENNMKHVKLYEEFIAEGFWSGYEYKKWVKANGKIKYPSWIKEQMKEIIEGGFMDPVYDAEHNYIYLWWNSLTDDQKFNSDKRKKALGDVAAKLLNDHYNDITGYTAFFFEGAAIALDLSKQVEDKLANGEAVEPAYYLAKEYFKNIGKDYNRSRVFNAAHEKLAEWMKLKGVETL